MGVVWEVRGFVTGKEKLELDLIYQKLLQKILFRLGRRNKGYCDVFRRKGEETICERIEKVVLKDRHSYNVAYYCYAMGNELGFSSSESMSLFIGGMLHDIGKSMIPDSILLKPSKLTKEEYEIVKKHSEIGYELIKNILNIDDEIVLSVTLHHHERIDGSGYPHQLKGEKIPFVARIAAIADAFDAMTSQRVYKARKNIHDSILELYRGKGAQFDYNITDLFIKMIYDKKIDLEKLFSQNQNELRFIS